MRIKVILQNYNTIHTKYQELLSAMLKEQEVSVWTKNLSAIESQNTRSRKSLTQLNYLFSELFCTVDPKIFAHRGCVSRHHSVDRGVAQV